MSESVEVTIVIGEDRLLQMLNEIKAAKVNGDHSVLVEYGEVNFQIYAIESSKLKEFNEAHPT